jgi:hypothetical protein
MPQARRADRPAWCRLQISRRASQVALFFGIANADQLRLCRSELGSSRALQRLSTLAPQISQVGNTVLIEQEAATWPLDHAFGFELADVGPAAIEVLR